MGFWQISLPFFNCKVGFPFCLIGLLDIPLFPWDLSLPMYSVMHVILHKPNLTEHGSWAAFLVVTYLVVCQGGDLPRERAWNWVPEGPRLNLAPLFISSWFWSWWVLGASASHLETWDNGIDCEGESEHEWSAQCSVCMVNLWLHGYTQQYFPAESSPQPAVLRLLIETGGKKINPFVNANIMHPEPQVPSKRWNINSSSLLWEILHAFSKQTLNSSLDRWRCRLITVSEERLLSNDCILNGLLG